MHPPFLFGRSFGSGMDPDFVIVGRENSAIGDRAAGQVSRQILDHLCRMALAEGRPLDEHVPVNRFQFPEPGLPLLRVVEELHFATDLELSLAEQSPQGFEVSVAKRTPQLPVISQIRFLAAAMLGMPGDLPTLAVQSRTGPGDQGVKMRMMLQLLVSCVQDHQRCRMEFTGPAKFAVEGRPGTARQQAVQFGSVTQNQRRQFVG